MHGNVLNKGKRTCRDFMFSSERNAIEIWTTSSSVNLKLSIFQLKHTFRDI